MSYHQCPNAAQGGTVPPRPGTIESMELKKVKCSMNGFETRVGQVVVVAARDRRRRAPAADGAWDDVCARAVGEVPIAGEGIDAGTICHGCSPLADPDAVR
jgi:hypothetical protein